MKRSIKDVIDVKDEITGSLDKVRDEVGFYTYEHSVMESVIVWSDKIALRYLESLYRFNSQFAPHSLPGCGMAIGDIIEHEGKRYLTGHIGVMMTNSATFYRSRRYEKLLGMWIQEDELRKEMDAFLASMPYDWRGYLPEKTFDPHFGWCGSYAGFDYVGTPRPDFVEALGKLAENAELSSSQAVIVKDLHDRLLPYADLVSIIDGVKKEMHRKGIPYIENGMFELSSPSSSGGASWHSLTADDDINKAILGGDPLVIVAGQTPWAEIPHIGGGHVPGKHYVLQPPRTPFYEIVQNEIDKDESLEEKWKGIVADNYPIDEFQGWQKETEAVVRKVIADIVPKIVENDVVLGFHFDLISRQGYAYISPVISETAARKEKDLITACGLRVIEPGFDDFVLETSDGYGFMTDPVFH